MSIFVLSVPPSRITVTDHRGAVLADKQVIGPYNEGEKVVLKCQAHGGKQLIFLKNTTNRKLSE